MRKIAFTYVVLLLIAVCSAPAEELATRINSELDSLEKLYKHLHANPELSWQEKETSARIADELRGAGYEVTTNVGGYGVVGVMKNGPGKTVLVRTDLDALPVEEKTGRPYASKARATDDTGNEVGVMHACGHDMHMTSFAGTARMLAGMKDQWSGTLVMIGQPAEERGAGARAMLKAGLLERFPKPDYAIALHVAATLPAGAIGYRAGYALANVDSVDITIRGVGGHGAYPHGTKDPVVIAAQVILGLQTIVSRQVSPLDSAVVTVGSIHGGTKHNIISDEAKMQLTVRTYSDETRRKVLDSIQRITLHTARAAGVPEDREPIIKVSGDEYTPSTYNNPALVDRVVPVWKTVLGPDNVVETPPVMGGEDFSEYGRTPEKIPIFIFWLGTIDKARMDAVEQPATDLPPLHSPLFWPDPRPTIETGVKAMTTAVLELLKPAGE